MAIAKAQPGADEAVAVAELSLWRALTEAGAGNTRLADWYWWVSAAFSEPPPISELRKLYGKPGEALAASIRQRPSSPPPTDTASLPVLERVKIERQAPNRSALFRAACKGSKGRVSFKAQVDHDGYFQAPRVNPI